MSDMHLDLVDLEIYWAKLISIADEAAITLARASYSTIVAGALDFGVVLCDAQGRFLVSTTRGASLFATMLTKTVRATVARFPGETFRDGDVAITNTPWICAGHLADFAVVSPIWARGIIAYAVSIAHTSDVGGSIHWQGATDLFEEGLHVPVQLLYRQGVPNETLFEMIRANVRVPKKVIGDLHAQMAANRVAAARLREFLGEYEMATLDPLADLIQDRCEQAMRDAIEALPDGEYRYTLRIDGLGEEYNLPVCIRVQGDEMDVDYSGAPPQVEVGGINVPYNYTYGATTHALQSLLLSKIPMAEGCFRPVHVSAPERSILNAEYPAATMSRTNTGYYIDALISGALREVIPERVMAGSGFLFHMRAYGQYDNGEHFAASMLLGGGMGALMGLDGNSTCIFPSDAGNVSVEMFENRCPVVAQCREFVVRSGGDGQCRGGLGQRLVFEIDSRFPGTVKLSFSSRNIICPPNGLKGGGEGRTAAVLRNGQVLPATAEAILRGSVSFRTGETVGFETAGGGGFGWRVGRSQEARRRDQEYGYVDDQPEELR